MDERSDRIARRFDLPMLVAALLVVPVVAVEQSSLGEPWKSFAAVAWRYNHRDDERAMFWTLHRATAS